MNDKPTTKVWEAAGFLMITMVISRVLGYLRDVFIYASFGQNNLTDAYNAAFSIPDFLYMVLVGGALSSALIPVLGSYIANDQQEEGWRVTSIVYSCVMVLLFFGVVLGMIFTPQLVNLMVPGFDAPTKLLTVRLTRIMFIQVIFMCMAGISMGVLNSYKRFAPSAIGSMIYNVGIIIGGLLLMKPIEKLFPGYGIAAFSVGVVLGAALYFFVQVPALKKVGFRYRFDLNFRHPGVRKILGLMLPVFIGLTANQINLFVNQNIASMFDSGIVAALHMAQRLMQLPISIFAIAIAVAVFPTMTAYAGKGNMAEYKRSSAMGLRTVLFVTIPSTIALMVLRQPLITFMFEFGGSKFTAESSQITATALWFYSIGIFAYGAIHILSRSFYALQDTRTPVTAAVYSILANIVLSVSLSRMIGYVGLPLAYSLSGIINMFLLVFLLHRKVGRMGGKAMTISTVKTLLASAVMGVSLLLVCWLCGAILPMAAKWAQLAELLACFVVGVGVFLVAAFAFKMEEADMLIGILKRRFHLKKHPKEV